MSEQQNLLTLIFNDNPALLAESGFDIRGINIYRRNLFANAQRALSITYPTIFQLLDSDVSDDLVKQFLKLCPPEQGDWAQWGEEFPHFIATHQISHEYHYLPDCALLDWYRHCGLHGKDQNFNHDSLSLLGTSEPEKVYVTFNQNVILMDTRYPIVDIFNAHHHPDQEQREMAMRDAKIALSIALQEHTVMIFRPEFLPKVTIIQEGEMQFMKALFEGESLGVSLDTVSHDKSFSFEKWLIMAIEQNLVVQFTVR